MIRKGGYDMAVVLTTGNFEDENQELAAKYYVMSIPTFLVLKGQDVIARTMGVQDKSSLVTAIESAF